MISRLRFFKFQIFFLTILITMSGCVSVNIPQPKVSKAEKISYKEPQKPFRALVTENADKAWQSAATGNTISYNSECNSPAETQLKTLESESFNSLTKPEVLSSQATVFDGREALESLGQGSVDGIPVKMALLIYKKNNCNFTISFVGRKTKLDSEKNQFNEFKNSFQYQDGVP